MARAPSKTSTAVQKYRVAEGACIVIKDPKGQSTNLHGTVKCWGGEVVSLTAAAAREHIKHKALDPFVAEDPEDEDEDDG